jgi:hypothetical protein
MPKLQISTQAGLTDSIELSYEQLKEISLLPDNRKAIATIDFGSALEVVGVFIPSAFNGVSTAAVSVGTFSGSTAFVGSRSLSASSVSYNSGSQYTAGVPKLLSSSASYVAYLYVTGDIANATSGKLIVGMRNVDLTSLLNN